jgi:peptidoglycan/xylan/chitin deacetylase (PgdA/CDA1 family)
MTRESTMPAENDSPQKRSNPTLVAFVAIVVIAGVLVFLVVGSDSGSRDQLASRPAASTTVTTFANDDSGAAGAPGTTAPTVAATTPAATVAKPLDVPSTKQMRAFLAARSTLPVELRPAPAPKPVPIAPTPGPLAPVYSRVPTTQKVIFIGIDDGLVRDPKVVQLLAQAHIPFSAFLVQSAATADPAYWNEVQHVGGTVESHTIHHLDLTKLSAADQRLEICGTLDPYQQEFGRRPTLFRPPYGLYNDSVRKIAASCGFKAIIMWMASTNPGRIDFQEGTIHPGDIFLMHWRTDLYDDLRALLALCHQDGYAIGRLEDYFSPGT